MKKQTSFIEQLQERKKKSNTRLKGLVAVQACKGDILNGIAANFTLKEIYNLLIDQGRMPVTYSGFVKMVRKHIQPSNRTRKKNGESQLPLPETEKKEKEPRGMEQLKKDKGPRPDHVYNPDDYDPQKLW